MIKKGYSPSEEQIQQAIREWCGWHGYIALQTTHRMRRCWNCGEYPTKGYGTDPGVPDLIVTAGHWPKYVWVGIEVKSAKGSLNEPQRVLRDLGRIAVARSIRHADSALKDAEQLWREHGQQQHDQRD